MLTETGKRGKPRKICNETTSGIGYQDYRQPIADSHNALAARRAEATLSEYRDGKACSGMPPQDHGGPRLAETISCFWDVLASDMKGLNRDAFTG